VPACHRFGRELHDACDLQWFELRRMLLLVDERGIALTRGDADKPTGGACHQHRDDDENLGPHRPSIDRVATFAV
jgi:hypothetical protein